jgi:putative membrane protein
LRELALLSVIQNRGLLPIGAVVGVLWELGLLERVAELVFGENVRTGGFLRDAVAAVANGRVPEAWQIAGALATFGGALAVVQILSVIWVVARLHGFVLTRTGDGLRTDYGLLTRVTTTVPLRRVQTLTIQQGPLQRLAGRASVRVETAGGGSGGSGGVSPQLGGSGESGKGGREWLAPIIRTADVRDLVRSVLPGVDPDALTWHAPHPGAFRRAVKPTVLTAMVVSGVSAVSLGPGAIAALPVLLYWAVLSARKRIQHMAWAETDDVVAFRSGWIRRYVTIARMAKIQVVRLTESPFDRRAQMSRVRVDTAGAGERSHGVDIPYLGRDVAIGLSRRLALGAASTEFRW